MILGVKSEFKCPICLVPADALWDLCGGPYPERTRNKTLTLIAHANEQTTMTATRKTLVTQSIRGIPVRNMVAMAVTRDADDIRRIYSSNTLAFTHLCTKCFVPIRYTRSSKECGVSTSGSGSRRITFRGVNLMRLTRGISKTTTNLFFVGICQPKVSASHNFSIQLLIQVGDMACRSGNK